MSSSPYVTRERRVVAMYASGILPYDIGMVTYNWKFVIHLREDVDPATLDDAVQKAARRYPYFMKRLVKEGESYEIVDNDLPIVVYDNTDELRPLNHESTNYHLVSVSYSGKAIHFAISHMLAGGCGHIEWVRTVLYLYLSKKHGVVLLVDGIWLPGDEIPGAERQFLTWEGLESANDGTGLDIEAVRATENGTTPILDYALGLGFPKLTKKVYYRFEFPQKEFMQKARSVEASPSILLAGLMFMALRNVWPNRMNDIQAMITHNYRAEVGLPKTTCDLVRYIHAKYPEKLEDATLDKVCTITRGQVILQSDKAFALRDGAHVLDRIETVDALPTLKDKKKYCQRNGLYGPTVTDSYQVSYLGRTEWGDMAPYIEAGDVVTEGHLMLEVLSVDDRIYATLQQEVSEQKYKDAFIETLDAEGISYSVTGPLDKRIPPMNLPE